MSGICIRSLVSLEQKRNVKSSIFHSLLRNDNFKILFLYHHENFNKIIIAFLKAFPCLSHRTCDGTLATKHFLKQFKLQIIHENCFLFSHAVYRRFPFLASIAPEIFLMEKWKLKLSFAIESRWAEYRFPSRENVWALKCWRGKRIREGVVHDSVCALIRVSETGIFQRFEFFKHFPFIGKARKISSIFLVVEFLARHATFLYFVSWWKTVKSWIGWKCNPHTKILSNWKLFNHFI